MNTTPNANRKHIGIYGNTNSGKSSLMNKILGQDISLVCGCGVPCPSPRPKKVLSGPGTDRAPSRL